MDKTTQFLFDWTYHFIKNKDVILKKIVDIQEHINHGFIFVKQKDKSIVYFIAPFVEDLKEAIDNIEKFKKSTKATDGCLVVLNSEDNLKQLTEKWGLVKEDPKFSMIFANPFSNLDKRWIINPYVHNKFSDPEALETGLKSLFESVEPISKETAERMIKP